MPLAKQIKALLLCCTSLATFQAANAQDAQELQDSISDVIVVRGRNIPEPQRATSQVASFLSADDLERSGDENAALALTRLSGLSVVGGRFAYVRGLGDRYSSARLNGSVLPSPEPLRRTVPLDLFPSNVLAGAVVQKTYSADYSGEFGGGVIDLNTLRVPDESFLNIKGGIGANLITTGKNGLFVNGSDLDFLGYDDGLRSLPDPLADVVNSGTPLASLDDSQVEVIGESLVNSPLTVIQNGTLGPNFDASINAGTAIDLNDGLRLGLVGVVGYDQEWTNRDGLRQTILGTLNTDFETKSTSMDATVNGLAAATLEWDTGAVTATGLYIHSTLKESQIDEGVDRSQPGSQLVTIESNTFLQRQLYMGQLSGDQRVGENIDITWRTAFARSNRDSPYEWNLMRFRDTVDSDPVYSFANKQSTKFSYLTDDVFSGGLDVSYEIPFAGPRAASVSVGYEYSDNERDYDIYSFRFAGGNSLPEDVQSARPDYLFSPDNIDPSRFFLSDASFTPDLYDATMTTHAGYFKSDFELIPTVTANVGVRYETAEQIVQTSDRFGNIGSTTTLDNDYWLPTATVTWNFADNMQFRVGYSHTIARPQFRELAQSLFFDPETNRSYRGNRFLVDSEFRNYDARFEYYLGRNQFITLAGFYKTIDNPIEEILFTTTGDSFDTTFINSPKAELFGGEAEYRTRFDILWNDWFERREWIFSVNYTFTESEIKVEAGDVVINPLSGFAEDATLFGLAGQPLQGTPKHIVNSQVGWEGENDRFTVLFGWVDERILQRGSPTGGIPTVYETPGIQLDAVYGIDVVLLGTDATISLSGRNLLATRHEEFQLSDATPEGRTEFQTYDRGRSISAGLTIKF
ncbi:TonB-dependent receptor domain-containing protein [Hyphococcus sp. DH-69]|uniref:TonB-dependent receptor domain-containing protein n=1 Tax=Hyphococcus formosus TaxID=3143534 RepID=UPI00398B7FD2